MPVIAMSLFAGFLLGGFLVTAVPASPVVSVTSGVVFVPTVVLVITVGSVSWECPCCGARRHREARTKKQSAREGPAMGRRRWTASLSSPSTPMNWLAEKTGHDRMPVIIKCLDYQRWLEPSDKAHSPIDSHEMKAWRVDRRVNNVRNNDPSLCEPVMEEDFPEKPKPAKRLRPTTKADERGQLDMFG
jgi:hypothetical protein